MSILIYDMPLETIEDTIAACSLALSVATLLFSPIMLFVPVHGFVTLSRMSCSSKRADVPEVEDSNDLQKRRKRNVRQALGISPGAVKVWILMLGMCCVLSQLASVAFLSWALATRRRFTPFVPDALGSRLDPRRFKFAPRTAMSNVMPAGRRSIRRDNLVVA